MKYFYPVLLILFACNSKLNLNSTTDESDEDQPEVTSGGDYDSGDHGSGCGSTSNSIIEFEVKGKLFRLEIPAICEPVFLDRGDPEPDQQKNIEFEIYQNIGVDT